MDILKHKNKILAIIIIVLILGLALSGIHLFNYNTLKQTNNSYTHEAGKKLVLNVSDFFDVNEKQAAQITFDTSAVDIDTIGEYTVTANYNNRTFEIDLTVADTTAPTAELSTRYIFTNNIEQAELDTLLKEVTDASAWSAMLVRFEKYGNLEKLDEQDLKRLTDTIPLPASMPELEKLGTETIPAEEGIYRAVMKITDIHGNYILEEIFVIYDTTGAYIEDTADKTITVEKEALDKEPEIDKNDYNITDNVDGKITNEDIQYELELRDADKHEWIVHVSYTDRAGNKSMADFLIIIKEKQVESQNNNTHADTPKTEHNSETAQPEDTPEQAPENNTPNNETVENPETEKELNPSELALIEAGFGVVVDWGDGEYSILMPDADTKIDGKDGSDILREYLAERKLVPQNVSGGWLPNADYYCYTAKNVHELLTPDDEEFWD